MRNIVLSSFLSVLFHLFLFFPGTVLFINLAEYDVESAAGGVEVNLIAALPNNFGREIGPETEPRADAVELEARLNPTGASAVNGDGSSPVPGLDPTTFFAPGGGSTEGKPGFLRNPAPRYPELARKLSQQGRVVLAVVVDKEGRPASVRVKTSSGFTLLDGSAVEAVRRWTFRPKRVASLPVESDVEIPIRFQLEKE